VAVVAIPRVSGGLEEHGHLEEFRTDPIGLMQRVRDECGDVGWFQLAGKLKETLRLHPPLIILMRVGKRGFEVQGHPIHEGDFVAASPAISNRIPEDFPDPDDFAPERYEEPRQEDLTNRWTWIPFGAGRHRCVGAAFATMQIKVIFSVLLREYEFEMTQPSESYRNDHSKMVVQLAHPAIVRYRRRAQRRSTATPNTRCGPRRANAAAGRGDEGTLPATDHRRFDG
jgi:hypothetical protein